MGKPRKKKTREEWDRYRRERDDLTRRLEERIAQLKAKIAADERERGDEAA